MGVLLVPGPLVLLRSALQVPPQSRLWLLHSTMFELHLEGCGDRANMEVSLKRIDGSTTAVLTLGVTEMLRRLNTQSANWLLCPPPGRGNRKQSPQLRWFGGDSVGLTEHRPHVCHAC